jgi:hypothetical protein
VPVFARRHLDLGGGVAARLALRAQPALEPSGERLIDDAVERSPDPVSGLLRSRWSLAMTVMGVTLL